LEPRVHLTFILHPEDGRGKVLRNIGIYRNPKRHDPAEDYPVSLMAHPIFWVVFFSTCQNKSYSVTIWIILLYTEIYDKTSEV